jgi:hypothetical protein
MAYDLVFRDINDNEVDILSTKEYTRVGYIKWDNDDTEATYRFYATTNLALGESSLRQLAEKMSELKLKRARRAGA